MRLNLRRAGGAAQNGKHCQKNLRFGREEDKAKQCLTRRINQNLLSNVFETLQYFLLQVALVVALQTGKHFF